MNRWNIFFVSAAAAAITLALLAGIARGQQTTGAKGQVVKVQLEMHDPPFDTHIKTLLEGAKVDMLPGGRLFLFTGMKLSTFSTNDALERLAETPQCVFDSVQKTVSSDQHLQVWTADGMFTEGVGFFLQLTNSNLIISNRVRTTIRHAWTNSILQ
jgi:hypothetical protein